MIEWGQENHTSEFHNIHSSINKAEKGQMLYDKYWLHKNYKDNFYVFSVAGLKVCCEVEGTGDS